jgi:cobyrinic acid a,c-diamide synthase
LTIPRILVAGTHSGVGKTTVATGIMAAFHRRGLRVQGFKVGPDFIDPTFHRAATGRFSRNLDGWMLDRETNLSLFCNASQNADVVVIEGVMGLFDGKDGRALSGTTAEMAIWLDAAVVLVLDGSAIAGSAAAVVHGFDTLIPELRVTAVVANRIAGERHYDYLRDAIRARCRPEAIGYLPRDPDLAIPNRHLGLHLAGEVMSQERLERLAGIVESHIDLDRLLKLSARSAPAPSPRNGRRDEQTRSARIGIARDRAFCFYYQDNLDLLCSHGAELVEFSPIDDHGLPPGLNGIYLGGGYPELHVETLAANLSMRSAVAQFIERDGPVYAECGGFMYLTEGIADAEGRVWPMAGVFPTIARMHKRLARIGYIEVQTAPGEMARGHEFRYSEIDAMPEAVCRVHPNGYRVRSATGSYVHLHFLSCPAFARRFVESCLAHR